MSLIDTGNWTKMSNGAQKNINTEEMVISFKCECAVCGYHTGNQGLGFHYCPNCGVKIEWMEDNRKK